MAILILRATCRVKLHNDPRAELKANGRRYVYSVLHAHQVAAVINGERGTGAMVSRSADGQIIVPALWARGIVPIRGSGHGAQGGKGGIAALEALVRHVGGGKPAYLAVDGPRGPRGHVHKGIAVLAQDADAVVLNLVAVPSRRWILHRAWDRLQIPKPFSTIHGYFSEPLAIQTGESIEHFRLRVETSLQELEALHDGLEASREVPRSTRDGKRAA